MSYAQALGVVRGPWLPRLEVTVHSAGEESGWPIMFVTNPPTSAQMNQH
ncbi:MAG: hypothetical protein ACRDST_15330 [Pseudonocardiaceae bacterium]